MMRSRKVRFFALALVAMMAFTTAAMAAYVYESRYGHNTLKRGHSNSYVWNLQEDINDSSAAANCGTVDGIFGSGTEHGVREYQRIKGLSVDGQAGYNTKTTLWYDVGYRK
jgi:peptidoglycan hydrolase-like protein with peptidoglycan-binding domain